MQKVSQAINEEVQREALKGFYDRCLRNDKYSINSKDTPHCQTKIITWLRLIARNAEEQGEKIERKLRRATIVAHFVSPIVAITFAVVYWVIGMYNVTYPGVQQEI